MMKTAALMSLIVGTLLLAAPHGASQSVFKDQFDSYPIGPWDGQGGWAEWVGSSGVSGLISSNFALTGTKSGLIIGDDGSNPMGDDMVYDFALLPGGRPGGNLLGNGVWAITVNTYLPTGATGQGWVILLNSYPTPVGDDYSVQIRFDNGTGEVSDRSFNGGAGTRRSIQYDRWIPLTVIVDLDDLRFDVFYAGQRVRSGATWTPDPLKNILAAIDLYASEPGSNDVSEMYFDDICVEKVKGAESVSLSMTPNPVIGGQNITINSHAPELSGAPAVLFATFVSGIPIFRPILQFTYNGSGEFGLTAPVPNGTPAVDIAFKVFTLGSQGLSASNEMRAYFQ